MSNYYFCYDEKQKDFLKKNNINYITQARAIKTNRKFWLFESNNKLSWLLDKYNSQTQKPPKRVEI